MLDLFTWLHICVVGHACTEANIPFTGQQYTPCIESEREKKNPARPGELFPLNDWCKHCSASTLSVDSVSSIMLHVVCLTFLYIPEFIMYCSEWMQAMMQSALLGSEREKYAWCNSAVKYWENEIHCMIELQRVSRYLVMCLIEAFFALKVRLVQAAKR